MSNRMLDMLLKEYGYKGDPKYISNKDIEDFFKEYSSTITVNDFRAIKKYFLQDLGVPRYVFTKLEGHFQKGPQAGPQPIQGAGSPPRSGEFREVMVLKRYSPRTIKAYMGALGRANKWCLSNTGKPIDCITAADARKFFLELIDDRGLSPSLVRICRSSLKLYFSRVLRRTLDLSFLEGMKSPRHLPSVATRNQIMKILDSISNTRHRTMIGLLYASGLRLSELVSLRISDLDLESLTIHVRGGKGRKDRITIFSRSLEEGLRFCMLGKSAKDFIFTPVHYSEPGSQKHISGRTVQKVLENAVKKAGLSLHLTPHDLRHCFATHLMENGISIRYIQNLLGHKNISTTTIYTKVAKSGLVKVKSPL